MKFAGESGIKRKEYVESEIREDYKKLTELLIKQKMTIATMESATAGQVASLITDCEGSSSIFPGAYVTYCNEEKIRLGVPEDVIRRYSVYSKEVAEAMAKACKSAFGTDIGIGVTGTMGNTDPLNVENSIPGQVYFAICLKGEVCSFFVEIAHQPSRFLYKLAVAKEVYDELVRYIIEI